MELSRAHFKMISFSLGGGVALNIFYLEYENGLCCEYFCI